MTELETRLTDALKALSTQWDADQQQHVVLPPSTVATPPLSRSNQTA